MERGSEANIGTLIDSKSLIMAETVLVSFVETIVRLLVPITSRGLRKFVASFGTVDVIIRRCFVSEGTSVTYTTINLKSFAIRLK